MGKTLKTRRNFLKIAGASALGLAVGKAAADSLAAPPNTAAAKPAEHQPIHSPAQVKHEVIQTPLPNSAKQWAAVIDTHRLQDKAVINRMATACRKAHSIPQHKNKNHEIKWIWAEKFHHAFPSMENKYLSEKAHHQYFPVMCNHCENPPCVKACPTRATFKRKDGIVMMDYHRCIGCRFCMAGCPYGARSFNFVDPRPAIDPSEYNPRFPTRTKGVVEKCNFCTERLAKGKLPVCVEASGGAMYFGALEDVNSVVRQLLKENFTIRRKPSLGTEPAIYYIV